ncbi:unnamed protein product [Notodromas monacha]|uniref:FERM domain-containing protein n=1 Tax=Notodromas monacha TaxID=399045 RepID=A0A7R9BGN5_9CRUS|nr:unnamed protein product [Notodromas monacha]CAG0913771.1 unnamed protein product [Notodromas monacha]
MMSSRVVAIMICTVWFVLQIFPYSKRPVCAGRGLVALISALCVLSEPVGRQPEAKSRSLRVMCCGASGIDAAMKWLRIFGGDHAPQPADKRGGNLFLVKIMLLDDTEIVHEISTDMKGGEVLDQVFKRLNLLETPYFGLRYLDRTGQTAGYVSELRLFPSQTAELEEKIAELHRGLLGQVPAVAEMKFLEKVKWLDLYGVDLHPVMGEGNIEYFVGLTPSGVLVLKNKSKVGYYFWPRISKVYFQRRYFMLRVKDGASQERTFGFELPTRQACKHLWRCCVEHHAFFRLTGGGPATGLGNKPPATPKLTTKAFSFVSKFRYSGRTQKEAMEDAKRNARTPPPDFPRRVSKRQNYLKQRRIASGNPSFSDSELACDNKENLRSLNGSTGSSSTLPRIFLSVPKPKANSVILPDSPQSSRPGTRWNSQRGLFSNQSPRSIRSAEVSRRRLHKSEQTLGRSSSVDSITSNDSSRRCRKRHHHHSSRHNSDNESEKSTRSGVSNRHHHFYQNRASRNVMSGKESESDFSDPQAIQRRANQNVDASKHKTEDEVWRSAESGHDVEQRIRRTHRSRSRSPGAAASRARNQLLPEQVRQHMAFNLVDPSEHGMSVDQLRDIPYTKVETNGRPLKIHYSPQAKKVYVKKGVGTPGFPSPVYTQQTMRKDVGYRGINSGYVASRMPVPQPRNSQYYKSSDYVNQSLCASIGVPAAAGQVQGASSQELSTEL